MIITAGWGSWSAAHNVCMCETTQQTRDIDPMLDQCWASVVDGGQTLVQHWVDVSFLLGSEIRYE